MGGTIGSEINHGGTGDLGVGDDKLSFAGRQGGNPSSSVAGELCRGGGKLAKATLGGNDGGGGIGRNVKGVRLNVSCGKISRYCGVGSSNVGGLNEIGEEGVGGNFARNVEITCNGDFTVFSNDHGVVKQVN